MFVQARWLRHRLASQRTLACYKALEKLVQSKKGKLPILNEAGSSRVLSSAIAVGVFQLQSH